MKILYTITGLTVGGAETITVNLAVRMHELGHTVKIMYLSGEQLVQVPQEIETVNLCMKKTPLGFVRALLRAKKIVREFQPDVVHGNMFHANFFCRILRPLCSVPRLVCTEHNKNIQSKLRMFLVRITDGLCDITTNVSQEAVDYFIEQKAFRREKSRAVYNGIDVTKFRKDRNDRIRKEFGIPDGMFVFINVSRIMPAKDHKNLLDAFKIVHNGNANTKLVCVGTGDLFEETVSYAHTIGLDDSVIFSGTRSDIPDFYNNADCFVLSSAWEGFGIVLAEAMACELPVISTDCGGTREVVQDERWLAPVKRSDLLAEKMLSVLDMSESERVALGKKNRERVQKFSLANVTEQWLSIYENRL